MRGARESESVNGEPAGELTAGEGGNIAPKPRRGAGDLQQFFALFSCGYGNLGAQRDAGPEPAIAPAWNTQPIAGVNGMRCR
jgi:hypothetical protein